MNKQKLVVHIDHALGRPVDNVESAKLSSELGQLARESMPVPTKWKELKESELMIAFDQLDMNLTIDNPDQETIEDVLELLKHRSRHQRHKLNKHFKKFSSMEEAIQNKPCFGGLTQENWEMLCNLFNDPKYQERCKTNKENRSKMKTNHNQGSRSFVVARHMLSQEPQFNGNEADRISFYKHCYYTEGKGWVTPQCEDNHVRMECHKIAAETEGEEVNVDEIVDEVLGKKSSYIVGLGYGPKPKKAAANATIKMLQESLKEKEKENVELKEKISNLESTQEEHGRLLQKLLESQQSTSNLI